MFYKLRTRRCLLLRFHCMIRLKYSSIVFVCQSLRTSSKHRIGFIVGVKLNLVTEKQLNITKLSDFTHITLPSDDKSLRACERVGAICRNHVNHVLVAESGVTFACGTDSGLYTCVNIADRADRFHARSMSQNGVKVTMAAKRMIVAAGSDGVQLSRFTNMRKVVTVGEALTAQKAPRQVLSSFVTATNHYHIGRRWDERRESWVGFVGSLCLNDPGALADRRRLISSVRRDVACCVNGNCYHNLVAAVVMSSSAFIGIFHDQTNQTSSVCQFQTVELADMFSGTNYEEKRKTPQVNGKVANLAQCQIYETEMARGDAHQVLSDFSTGDNVLSDTFYQQSIIPRRHGQINDVAIEAKGSSEGSVIALIYANRIEKYSITADNKWLWNIELYSTVANNAKSVALFNDNLYVLNDHSLEAINMANCAYYQAEATCLIVSDVTCAWNPLDAQCQRMTMNSNLKLIKTKSQIEIQSQIVQKKAALDGTITLVADTSEDIYDSLEWFDPSQQKLVENETPMYTWFIGANKTQLLVYDTSAYLVNTDKLQFTLHYNIRNETTKMIIFEISHDQLVSAPVIVPILKSDQITQGAAMSGGLGSIVPAIIVIVAIVVIAIIIAICIMVTRMLPSRRRRRGSSKLMGSGGSKQASILDSDQSFILHAPDMHNLYERERTGRFEYNMQLSNGLNNSKPDQESFKSDYMSCSSKDLSSANSETEQQQPQHQMPKPDEAIIVFPDGTIGRLKATKLKKLKDEIDDVKLEDGEKALAGTLKRSRRK